jgi:hypothetical protein
LAACVERLLDCVGCKPAGVDEDAGKLKRCRPTAGAAAKASSCAKCFPGARLWRAEITSPGTARSHAADYYTGTVETILLSTRRQRLLRAAATKTWPATTPEQNCPGGHLDRRHAFILTAHDKLIDAGPRWRC